MLAALTSLDYGLVGLFLSALVAAGLYFSGRQRDATEFLLANRSLDSFPLSLSLVATLVTGQLFLALPALGYEQGLKTWIVPAAFWLILPVVVLLAVPLFRGLGVSSPFEYLELRFGSRVRIAAGVLFLLWRVVLLAAMTAWPCRAVLVAAGWSAIPVWWLVVLAGAVATLVAFLGGMRAVVWTGVAMGLAMFVGAIVVVGAIWMQIEGGPARVAVIAEGLGRAQANEWKLHWADDWTVWAALPHWWLASLALVIADQTIAQRFLAAKSVNVARTSYFAATIGLSLLLPMLLYAGVCLLAFYHDHPQHLRPEWVVNLHGPTRRPIRGFDGSPLLDENNPGHEISAVTIDTLIAEQRILQPNNKQPFTRAEEVIDADTNHVLVERLAMRRPPRGKLNGETIVATSAPAQMVPALVAEHLPMGAAGIVVVALLAATISPLVAGIHSLTTFLVVEWHRRCGWGRARLARRLDKTPEQLTPTDELRVARPMTLLVGVALTALAVACTWFPNSVRIAILATEGIAGPILAVFLLGMLTRRATATAALMALVLGVALAIGLSIGGPQVFASAWNIIFSFAGTLAIGYLLSFALGHRAKNIELRGLVAGCGTLGLRAIDEVTPLIGEPEERWR